MGEPFGDSAYCPKRATTPTNTDKTPIAVINLIGLEVR
jgi:hypothetical protein